MPCRTRSCTLSIAVTQLQLDFDQTQPCDTHHTLSRALSNAHSTPHTQSCTLECTQHTTHSVMHSRTHSNSSASDDWTQRAHHCDGCCLSHAVHAPLCAVFIEYGFQRRVSQPAWARLLVLIQMPPHVVLKILAAHPHYITYCAHTDTPPSAHTSALAEKFVHSTTQQQRNSQTQRFKLRF